MEVAINLKLHSDLTKVQITKRMSYFLSAHGMTPFCLLRDWYDFSTCPWFWQVACSAAIWRAEVLQHCSCSVPEGAVTFLAQFMDPAAVSMEILHER